ncbi:MAG: DUF302 domain-containing protein [Chloroflexota bacterium]|nr:DUF302 domain-containing protein [Chloroflexota bacterium]
MKTAYTFGITIRLPVHAARPLVEAALLAEGFGVLTEIDVAATLQAKLGISGPPYLILGACNPSLAHRALQADPSIGALLPCNVVLREGAGQTVVEAMDPRALMGLVEDPEVEAVAAEAEERLRRVIASLGVGR